MSASAWAIEIATLMFLLAVSATMSGTETALFSLSKTQLQKIKASNPGFFKKVQKLIAQPENLIATLLLGNEAVNIALAILITGIYDRLIPLGIWHGLPHWLNVTIVSVLTTTPLVFIFGEITPKILAARNNAFVASITVPFVLMLHHLLRPLRFMVTVVPRLILKMTGESTQPENMKLNEEEILALVDESRKAAPSLRKSKP